MARSLQFGIAILFLTIGIASAQHDGEATLHELAAAGRVERLVVALRQGADIDERDERGRTALHVAAAEGQLFAAMMLVGRGAVIDARDGRGRTPLHAAAAGREDTQILRVRIVQFLRSEGADPRRRDRDGQRPIDYASGPEIAEALLP